MCGPSPSCAQRSLPPLKSGEGDREAVVGFSDAQEARKNPSVSLRSTAPLAGEPRTVCAPSPPYATPLAFPLGGRWHGKAVTDEGRGQARVSATPKQEVQTLISHQCAHWCQLPPRGKPRGLCAPSPSCAQRPLPPLKSGEGRVRGTYHQTSSSCFANLASISS